jgi:CheY-like chemotaxis protein
MPTETRPQPEAPTVLVVDDDCDVRSALRDMLDASGYRSVCVSNGDEALAFLRRNPRPAAILLDLFMPVMNGWEFVRRVRATQFGSIPIMVVTSAEPHWGAPVPRVLRKPVSPEDLEDALSDAVIPPSHGASKPVSLT